MAVPTTVLQGVVDVARRYGVDMSSWFVDSGVTAEDLRYPKVRLTLGQTMSILRRAIESLPGPLGIEVGSRGVLASFGLLGFAILSCQNGAEAFTMGMQWHRVSGNLLDIEGRICGEGYVLELSERTPCPALLPFLCEELLWSSLILIREMIGSDLNPVKVELSYPAPSYAKQYEQFFGAPVQFESSRTAMIFQAEILRFKIPTFNPLQRDLALDAVRKMSAAFGDHPDVVAAVEALLWRDLRNPITMAEAARTLHMSERSLHRKLADANKRFSDLRDCLRRIRATELLESGGLSISAVAREVGFKDVREFRRAYIRWTGVPPKRGLGRESAANFG